MMSVLNHAYFTTREDDAFDEPVRAKPIGYAPAQLHERSERCWAVVGEPDGAIAETAEGRLIMRLTHDEARLVAAAMNAAIAGAVRPAQPAPPIGLVPA